MVSRSSCFDFHWKSWISSKIIETCAIPNTLTQPNFSPPFSLHQHHQLRLDQSQQRHEAPELPAHRLARMWNREKQQRPLPQLHEAVELELDPVACGDSTQTTALASKCELTKHFFNSAKFADSNLNIQLCSGPVPVLVMSLLFIASVFMLHIWGKITKN